MKFTLVIDVEKLSENNRLIDIADRLRWVAERIQIDRSLAGTISLPSPYLEIGEYGVEHNFSFGGDGVISIEQDMIAGSFIGTISMASSYDGQAWVCIDGASALRFNPKEEDEQ